MGARDDTSPGNQLWTLLFASWLVAVTATLGSLFFSEVMEYPPCTLCWYQRIFMFPLAVVLLVGLLRTDPQSVRYALPLAVGGWLVAAYHALLHMGVIPESSAPCQQGVSCSEQYVALLGFLSIPILSLIAFSVLVGLLVVVRRRYLS